MLLLEVETKNLGHVRVINDTHGDILLSSLAVHRTTVSAVATSTRTICRIDVALTARD